MNKKPKSNQQRSQERREATNGLARSLGFESWRKLETAMKKAYTENEPVTVVLGSSKYSNVEQLYKKLDRKILVK